MIDKWDERFLNIAGREVKTWSKDPSTKLGAVAVIDRRVVATGYNGFPKGIDDSPERYADRELKYELTVHAEMNVIYNAAEAGVRLRGATLYVDGIAVCHECAKGIIQTGIRRVVMRYPKMTEKWSSSFERTKMLFGEAGVGYECVEVESPVRRDEPVEPPQQAESSSWNPHEAPDLVFTIGAGSDSPAHQCLVEAWKDNLD